MQPWIENNAKHINIYSDYKYEDATTHIIHSMKMALNEDVEIQDQRIEEDGSGIQLWRVCGERKQGRNWKVKQITEEK